MLRTVLLLFLLSIGVQHTFAQLKQRNSRIEIASSSFTGIKNYGIISGGPSLSFTQKVSGIMEIGVYAGNTYGIQSNKFRLIFKPKEGAGVTQISRLTEFGVFVNLFLKQYMGSTAPIGSHLTVGLGYGSMEIEHTLTESNIDFRDRPRWNSSTNDHIRLLLGLGKTVQFDSHITLRGMVSMNPYIKLNEKENTSLPDFLQEQGMERLPTGPASPYSLFSVLFALGYQF